MKFLRLIILCLTCSLLLSCSAKEAKAIHFGPGPDDEETMQDIECSDQEDINEGKEAL